MNLFDMLASAQGGKAIENIGAQLGLSPDDAKRAVEGLLPSLSTGLKHSTKDEDGLRSLVDALNTGDHSNYADDQGTIGQSQTVDDGNGILGHIFGSKEVSRNVAETASASTGISSAILKKMLPMIAPVIMGALAKKLLGSGMQRGASKILKGGILSRLFGSTILRWIGVGFVGKILIKAVKAGGWTLFRRFMRGRGMASARSGTDFFGSMLDGDGDGSIVDDLFKMATSRR